MPGTRRRLDGSSPPVRVRSHERLEDFVLGVVVGGDDLPDVNLKQRASSTSHYRDCGDATAVRPR